MYIVILPHQKYINKRFITETLYCRPVSLTITMYVKYYVFSVTLKVPRPLLKFVL